MNVSFRFLSILFECILFYTTGRLWLVGCKLQKNQLAPIFPTHKNCLSNHVSYSIVIVLILCLKLIWRSYMVCEICVCLDRNYPAFSISTFPSFFFLAVIFDFYTRALFMILFIHYSWNPQLFYLEKKNIKNGSYAIIHIFKNYFPTAFSIFSFQQNKLYPNGS